jgi:two-component system phosphate regulon sensor histidine kinase PhoR
MAGPQGEERRRAERRRAAPARDGLRRLWPSAALVAGIALVFLVLVLGAGLDGRAGLIGFLATAILLVLFRAEQPIEARPVDGASAGELGTNGRALAAALVEALPDACFLLDSEGRVVARNAAAEDLLSPIERGQHISAALRAPEVLGALQEGTETGRAASVRYFERVPVARWLEAHVAPVEPERAAGGQGRATLLVLLLRDLSQEQRLERMRADFVANASHELRTPLASVIGFIETLQGPARDDAAARERFLEIMRQQAMRMARLISDLMSLSRIELSAHRRPDSLVDLRDILSHVRDTMAVLARENAVEIALDMAAGPLSVLGDRDELIQVFQNLVENAIKYGQQGGRVEIDANRVSGTRTPQRIEVCVRDHGPGIAPEHLPRLTERFYRVNAASSREKGGTGLGLAIVKHIANRHRAQLVVESRLGEGARFCLRFEAAD